MKKILCVLLLALLLLGLAACGRAPGSEQAIDSQLAESPAPVVEPEESKLPESAVSELLSYSMYLPNDNADGFEVMTVSTEEISAKSVLAGLKEENVLPEAVAINSFSYDSALISIDFNQAFADAVCSMGSSGELMIVGSLVNTFLDAFKSEAVYFTVDGQILESGHTIYDFPLRFFSIEPQAIS